MNQDANGLQSVSSTVMPDTGPTTNGGGLPIVGQDPGRERSDAARNRLLILGAAEELFAARGVSNVTMDDIAAKAKVGKGTLYRRFGDKGGLAVALLSERERELQESLIGGPPPLGPGAPPSERLTAFVQSYVKLVAAQLDLVQMSETSSPGARLRTGAHAFWRQHCRHLLVEGQSTSTDLKVDVILSSLSAEMITHWTRDQSQAVDAIAQQLAELALKVADLRSA